MSSPLTEETRPVQGASAVRDRPQSRFVAPASFDDRTNTAVRGLSWIRFLWRALVLGVVFVLGLEASARTEDWIRYRMPFFSPVKEMFDLWVRDETGVHGRPHAQFQQFKLNNLGMRGPDVVIAKDPGTLRILIAGASESFGLYESPGKDYPRQLEDSLTSLMRAGECFGGRSPSRVEVVNSAFYGFTLPTIEQQMQNRFAALRPDLVVLYPTPVGYMDDRVPTPTRPDSSRRNVVLPVGNRIYPRVYHSLRNSGKQMLPVALQSVLRKREIAKWTTGKPQGWLFEDVQWDRMNAYVGDLRHLTATIRQIGAVPIIGTHGNRFMGRGTPDDAWLLAWQKAYPRAKGIALARFDSVARLRTIEAGRMDGVQVVDLATLLTRGKVDEVFADYVHFRDAGSATVAGALAHAAFAEVQRLGRCGAP